MFAPRYLLRVSTNLLAVAAAAILPVAASAQCAGPGWLPGDGVPGVAGPAGTLFDEYVSALTRWDPDGPGPRDPVVVVAGAFTVAGNVRASNIALLDPATDTWSPLAEGLNGPVLALAVLPNGDLIAAGTFTTAGGLPANRIARWNGQSWSPLGDGLDDTPYVLALLPTGELAVAGSFTTAGTLPSPYFARYSFTGIPTVAQHPASTSIAAGQTLTLTAAPTNGYTNVRVQWQRNNTIITDGPAGASPQGGTVANSAITLPSPTRLATITLTITNAQPSDAGLYTATFINDCGSTTTTAAAVTITAPPCRADFTPDGVLNTQDIFDYITAYFAASLTADFNADAALSVQDIFGFLAAYFAGC